MEVENIFGVDRSNYLSLTKKQKEELYPKIITCYVCGDDLCNHKEYNMFLNTTYTGKRNLFLPVFFENKLYYREMCIKCCDIKYPNKKYNVTTAEHVKVMLNMSDDVHKRIRKSRAITLENQIKKYGLEEGTKRFEIYREKQAYTNSKEHHKMTDEEFDIFNKSRAITLENQIKKYGLEEGTKRFEIYRERQAYTNSLEYLIERHGEINGKEKFALIKFKKKHSFDTYLSKYGDADIAEAKLSEYWANRSSTFSSRLASDLFKIIDENISHLNINSYFTPKNKEFGKYSKTLNKYVLFDYVIPDLKLCIEFNGDCFHANPVKYKHDDCPNPFQKDLTAETIWKFDELKNDELIKLGFDVLIIWELDLNNDRMAVINNVVQLIKERYNEYNNRR